MMGWGIIHTWEDRIHLSHRRLYVVEPRPLYVYLSTVGIGQLAASIQDYREVLEMNNEIKTIQPAHSPSLPARPDCPEPNLGLREILFFPASGHRPAIAVGPAETQFEIWGLKALDGLGLTRTKR